MNKKEITSIIVGKLLNIGGILQKEGNRLLLPYGLNQQQFSVFYEIARVGKVKQKDMVNRLLLERANVSKIVKKLQRMELITISDANDDKRSSWLTVTDKGNSILKQCIQKFELWNAEWFNHIPAEQLQAILEKIELLQKTFRKKLN